MKTNRIKHDSMGRAHYRGLVHGCLAASAGRITPKQATAWYVRGLVEDYTLEEDPISGYIFRRLHEYADRILEMKYRKGYLIGVHAFTDGRITLDGARKERSGESSGVPPYVSVEEAIRQDNERAEYVWRKLHGKEINHEYINQKKEKKMEAEELIKLRQNPKQAFNSEGFTETEKRAAKNGRPLQSKTYRGIGYELDGDKIKIVEHR